MAQRKEGKTGKEAEKAPAAGKAGEKAGEEETQNAQRAADGDGAASAQVGEAERLTEALRELQARHEVALRQAADAQNAMRELQDRVSREQERLRQYAAEAMASALLPALDDLERALEGLQQAEADSAFTDGLELIVRNWLEVFGRFHIERLAPERGAPFDPHRHEAMSTAIQAEAAPNTVWELVQPGYLLHDRVLRPARVVVAQQQEADDAAADDAAAPETD